MKQFTFPLFIVLITFFVGIILGFGIKSLFETRRFGEKQTLIGENALRNRSTILDSIPMVAGEIGANPEGTMRTRENIQNTPFGIVEDTPELAEVNINIPRFLDQTLSEQDKFFQKVSSLKKYNLTVNVSGYASVDIQKMSFVLGNLPIFQDLNIAFYDTPTNYYELFDIPGWQNLHDKNLSLWIYGQSFPDGFVLDSLLAHVKKMIERPLSREQRLANFNLNIEEVGNMFFLLTSEGERILQTFPTNSLGADHILLQSMPNIGESLSGKVKIEKFFQESTIENIEITSVGKKEKGKIILYGF